MQTLVYENYNKFISATDTIREMQTHTDSMEAEMERLKEKVHRSDEGGREGREKGEGEGEGEREKTRLFFSPELIRISRWNSLTSRVIRSTKLLAREERKSK